VEKAMDLKIRINEKQRLAYIPKALFEILGKNVRASPNRAAVLLFAESTSIDDALKSLDIIKRDLIHAKELQQRKGETT
jgi:hypothetical protein